MVMSVSWGIAFLLLASKRVLRSPACSWVVVRPVLVPDLRERLLRRLDPAAHEGRTETGLRRLWRGTLGSVGRTGVVGRGPASLGTPGLRGREGRGAARPGLCRNGSSSRSWHRHAARRAGCYLDELKGGPLRRSRPPQPVQVTAWPPGCRTEPRRAARGGPVRRCVVDGAARRRCGHCWCRGTRRPRSRYRATPPQRVGGSPA